MTAQAAMIRLLKTLALALLFTTWSHQSAAEEFDSLYEQRGYVAPFQLTDQKGRTVTREDLRGKVWVASFFFSTCTVCNESIVQQLDKLHRDLAGWPDVQLVSFTVYPERDTTEQLGRFADQLQIDSERWRLLTGSKRALYNLIQKSFEQPVAPNFEPKPGAEVGHSFRFMIVDHRGRIRGYVDGKDSAEVDRLQGRVKELVQAKYLPTINATLNGISGVFLVLGYIAVRWRRIVLHKICMLSALLISALFLASYLYYHLAIQHGQPTEFAGEDTARWIYLAILLSHTVLATVVAPLALITAYLGVRDKLAKHMAVARWTLPLWLYVSVTGVVVYWMLYHLYPPG